MLKNYLKIAIRNLLRNKGFSAINISGLAIGMASALLILLWIQNELSFDRFYPKTDRLYLLHNRDRFGDGGDLWAWPNTPKVMASVVKTYSEVEDVSRFNNATFLTSVGETHLNSQGAFVDSGFLRMFDLPMIKGDAIHSLSGPYDIVLTQKLAKSLFGNEEALGKTIRIDSNANFVVSGIIKDPPSNTWFKFDYLLPWSFMTRLGWDDKGWGNNSVYTFVLLKPGISQASFDNHIRDITTSHSDETTKVFSQSLNRWHLYAKSENGQLIGDKIHIVQLFIAIAGFILLIACINFMNLSTARSERRAREVGIRKVVGAARGALVGQFIGESILISAFSFLIALLLAQASLSSFSQLVGKELHIDYSSPGLWLFSIGFILFTGLLAGSYPAFYLSSFQPVKVLKGTFRKVNALVSTRKILVVLQFSFAIILIICTLIIQRQIQYGQDRSSGYDRNNLVYTYTQGDVNKHYSLIRNELLSSGAAISVTKALCPITQHWSDGWGYSWDGSQKSDERTDFIQMGTDADFVKTMGTTLVAGRDIDVYQYPTDTSAILLNESAVKVMRLKNPIGVTIRRDKDVGHVVGVIKDFILESPFSQTISPMLIQGPGVPLQTVHFKLNPANSLTTNIAKAEKIFKKYNPQYPATFVFVDDAYARKFKDEQQMGQLAALFAGLTIFISCLGLFALATYMAENRIKEIGVRKVLGASVAGITTMLAKDFVRLVLISFVIAAPVAWFAMNSWLKNYTYKITIGWDIFASAGLLAIFIAVFTVSYQSIRAAIANPARSLRSE